MFFIARVFPSSAQSADVNWAPRSEVRLEGTPNLAIQPLMSASAHVVAEMSLTGIASGHLDQRTVYHREDVGVSLGLGQRAHQVDMKMPKSPLRSSELLKRRLDMSADFAGLAVGALLAPGPDIFLQVVPDKSV